MPPLTYDERVEQTRQVFRALQAWNLSPPEQRDLLGLDPGMKDRQLKRFRLGNPLPDEPTVQQRAQLLIRIHRAARQLFPHSEASADLWVTTPREQAGRRTPLDTMLDQGLDGIRQIDELLNRQSLL